MDHRFYAPNPDFFFTSLIKTRGRRRGGGAARVYNYHKKRNKRKKKKKKTLKFSSPFLRKIILPIQKK